MDFPQSVVEFFKGYIGTPYLGFPERLQQIILKGEKPLDGRPGATLPAVDFEAVRKELAEKGAGTTDEDVIAH